MAERKRIDSRDDLLKLIDENGGKAEGLDLSRAIFKEGIDLSEMDITGVILRGANLNFVLFDGSDLSGADLCQANLQYAKFNPRNCKPACLVNTDLRGASLGYAEFRDADLSCAKFGGPEEQSHMKARVDETDLRGAKLFRADFSGCFLYGTKLQGALIRGADLIGKANLAEADWGNHIIGEEQNGDFGDAETQYRYLKKWYASEGMYSIADQFLFREMTVNRKAAEWWPRPVRWRKRGWWAHFLGRPQLEAYRCLCGYGVKPWRVVASAAVVVIGMAGAYSASALTFWDSLYYSAVSFTALGYGTWAASPQGWAKWLGAAEAFIGVFLIALFLITFVRKMTR